MNLSENNLYRLSAYEAIELIKNKKITIRQLIESIIKRINECNHKTGAWIHLNYKQALEKADELDKKLSSDQNIEPLYGIPIGIKDIFNTQDFPTEMGSPIWKDFTPGNDARVVYYLRMANAIIMGKTETAEFAVHALGNSKNPYDPSRNPGTSSSGSAVAVATCMIPLALGTQTAGSITRPASYCGIYGFKPSFGLIPRTGMLKTTDSLDQVGYFARTPQDLEILFNIIRVKGRDYPLSESALNDEKRQSVIGRPWKVMFVKSPVWDQAEPYAQKLITKFIEEIGQDKEFQIDEFNLPIEFLRAHEIHKNIYTKSLSYYFKHELENKTLVSNIFYEFSSHAKEVTPEKFDFSIEYQAKLSKILDMAFHDFDIIISLSTAGHAPLRDEKEKDDPSLIWTMCGVPTISIPALKTDNGLPLGIQAVARRYNDKLLLQFVKLLHEKKHIQDAPYPELQ
jgi:Asp-tRNA(Asn)/Glu-tRNA(Gln) amidotransferase A subunit family amidase